MTPSLIGALSILFFLLLLVLRVHVGLALGLTGFIGVWVVTGKLDVASGILITTPYSSTAQFALAVLPLFILMGVFAGHAGFAKDAYDASQKWVGRLPGGLAIATIIANAIFGAACGSSAAACAVFTKASLPEMRRYGYQNGFACSVIAAAGVLSMLIPPSVLMLIYGIITEVSIGGLFIAGIFPGLLLATFYSIGIVAWVKKNPGLAGSMTATASWRDRFFSLRKIWGIIVLMLMVLGGIYAGVFTPTEAGAAGAFGSFALAVALRKLKLKMIWDTLRDATQTTAMIFFIFIGAQIYSQFMAFSGLPTHLIGWIRGANLPPLLVLVAFMVMYLILGCLLDSISMMTITLPIVFPISQAMGWDSLWFGILVIVIIEVGLLTPPVGINVFVVKAAAGPEVTLEEIFRGVIPLFVVMLVTLAVLIAFPQISVWLPGHMWR